MIKTNLTTRKSGFTLIETIVYLALFAILITGIVSSAFALFETSGRNQSKAMLQEEKDFALGKINYALNGVQSPINTPAAGVSGSSLTATKYDGTVSTINLSGSVLMLNGSALTNSNVTISKLVFIHTYAGGANPESVEAGFTIALKSANGATISQTASTTRYVRK